MIDRLLGPLGQIAAQHGLSPEAQDALIELFLSLQGETIGLVGSILVSEETASDSGEGDPIRRPEGGLGVRVAHLPPAVAVVVGLVGVVGEGAVVAVVAQKIGVGVFLERV